MGHGPCPRAGEASGCTLEHDSQVPLHQFSDVRHGFIRMALSLLTMGPCVFRELRVALVGGSPTQQEPRGWDKRRVVAEKGCRQLPSLW